MPWAFLIWAAAGLLLAGILYQVAGARRDRGRFPAPGVLGPVGPHRLHYWCEGTGAPAVALEAGIAASSLTWSRVQPILARSTRVCAYDRAGLAWSDAAATPRSIDALVSELRLVIAHAGITSPVVLVGHSFGGIVIRAFARAHPAEVAGLVFVDPLHPEEWCEPSPQQRQMLRGGIFLSKVGALLACVGAVRISLAMLSGGAPGAPRRFSRMFGRSAAALLQHMVTEVQKLPPEVLPAVQAHWSNPRAFRGMWQHLAAMPGCSADLVRGRDDFGDTPVVVLSAGARDPRWLEADARLARASLRGRHIISPHSGHWLHLDDPDLVVRAIQDLVSTPRR